MGHLSIPALLSTQTIHLQFFIEQYLCCTAVCHVIDLQKVPVAQEHTTELQCKMMRKAQRSPPQRPLAPSQCDRTPTAVTLTQTLTSYWNDWALTTADILIPVLLIKKHLMLSKMLRINYRSILYTTALICLKMFFSCAVQILSGHLQ